MKALFRVILYSFAFIVLAIFAFTILAIAEIPPRSDLKYGLTFSHKQARDLGLDWKEVYMTTLDDLAVRRLRLSAYWDETEPQNNQYNWAELDWQLDEAAKRQVEIILAVGTRLPRWPECHYPAWTNKMAQEQQQLETLEYIEEVVKRYRDRPEIKYWQVENEPFLSNFGECRSFDSAFLDTEIALVRRLDSRQIIITDSGELSLWVPAARRADIFGTTMYRDTYSKALQSYVHYPITPAFFRAKRRLASFFASPKEWIVIELQAEPWASEAFHKVSATERAKTMSPDKFREMIDFSAETGFSDFYLWGVEWWYWEKAKNGDERMWQEAKQLFGQSY